MSELCMVASANSRRIGDGCSVDVELNYLFSIMFLCPPIAYLTLHRAFPFSIALFSSSNNSSSTSAFVMLCE